jgi:hypothetical protein
MQVSLKKIGSNFIASFLDYNLIFTGVRIKGNKINSNLKIVDVTKDKVLFISYIELMDINERWKLAKHLEIIENNINWQELLTIAFTKLINEILTHDAPTKLQEVPPQSHYFIKHLIAEPFSLIFAPGGSGKSYLSLLVATAIQNGISLDGVEVEKPYNVLYLDWETSQDDLARRFTLIKKGLQMEVESPFYRSLAFPLAYEFDKILDDIVRYDIKLLIIDSVVPALGGDITKAEIVGDFFGMLKQFYLTNQTRSLLLTHISKQDKKGDNEKSPIGSVYFENYPRLVWELKSINLKNKLQIELKPYKFNVPAPPNLTFLFKFYNDAVNILTNEVVEETDETAEFIVQLLQQNGDMKIKDIIADVKKQFGGREDAIRKKIEELKKAEKIFSAGYGVVTATKPVKEQEEPKYPDEPPF